MKKSTILLSMLCLCATLAAQDNIQQHQHPEDSTDVFYRHLSRLKYLDTDPVTGRQGVYNMGRNVTFKLVVPLEL